MSDIKPAGAPPRDLFVPVRLEVRTGELVTTGFLPRFDTDPDVVFWGTRVFRFHARTPQADYVSVYREAYAVPLLPIDGSAGQPILPGGPPVRGLSLIIQERYRQVEREDYTAAHDDQHVAGELARAAAWYAAPSGILYSHGPSWPWSESPPKEAPRWRRLVMAGALIAAELDRLLRRPPSTENDVTSEESH